MIRTGARRSLDSEEGFALMEVIVAAAVLVLIVLGVLAGIDSVSRTAAANHGKTVAATLAEKDLERLRALRTSDLNRLDEIEIETRTVRVGITDWNITSKAEWVTDTDGELISCALTGDKGSYLRITSSVLPASAPAGTKPVTMSSIVAPQPGKGTLTALVKDHAGAPVVGLPVQAIGPTSATKPTNSAGCAVFDESEAGSYKLRLDYSGWVDPDGNRLVEKNGTVSAGNLTTVEFIYDRAGSFPVTVVTRRPGETVDRVDRSNGVIAAHTGVSSGYRAMTSGTGATGFTFTSMFPFATPYEVYSGTCTGNNPAVAIPDSNYFTNRPLAVAQVTPGTAGPTRYVLEPAIDVTVRYRNGGSSQPYNPVSGARVYVYPKTADCSDTDRVRLGITGSSGKIPADTEAGPGMPFGTYDVCASYNSRRIYWSDIQNTDPNGTALAADIRSGDSTASCPS
jgi:Tfp pilus assembly protein PilV